MLNDIFSTEKGENKMNGFEPQPMGGPSASQAETWGSFGPSGANPFC
jgi:hypothetical protein